MGDFVTSINLDGAWPHPRHLTVQIDGVTISECMVTGVKMEQAIGACGNPDCGDCGAKELVIMTAEVSGPAL